ncbi:hypothetical protein ACIS_01093 [Anaplasma centrale str. Israel]|uniref:Uncharacterized protein n=2 Tax=Anaplasma centrale TaxID=769 RepID=D1ASW0_ANACI|nr:hypothetical protein ACIS_01093 [Anaplasma centrale str. Israel]
MDKRICGEGGAAVHRAVPVAPDDQQRCVKMDKRICGEGGAAVHRAVPVAPDDQQRKKQRPLITRIVLRIVAFIYMLVAVAVHALLTIVVTPPRLIVKALRALDRHGRVQVAGTRALLHEGAKTVHAIGAASRDQAERLRQGLPAFAPAAATTSSATQVPAAKAATVIIEEDAAPAKRRKSPKKAAATVDDVKEDAAPAKRRKSPKKAAATVDDVKEDAAPAKRRKSRRKKAAATETVEAAPAETTEADTTTVEATPAPTAGVWCASCGHVHPPAPGTATTTAATEDSTSAADADTTTVEATPAPGTATTTAATEDSTSAADAGTTTVEATPAPGTATTTAETEDSTSAADAGTTTVEATPAPGTATTTAETEDSTSAADAGTTTVEATPAPGTATTTAETEDSTSAADAGTTTVEATPAPGTATTTAATEDSTSAADADTTTVEATPAPTAGVWCASCGHVHPPAPAAKDPEVERLAGVEIEDDVSDDDEVTTSTYTETSVSDDDEVAKKGARAEPAARQSVRAKIALAVHTIYGRLRMTFVMLMEIFLMPGYAAIGWIHPDRTAKGEVESTHVVRGVKHAAQKTAQTTKSAAASLAASVRHMWYRLSVMFMMIVHLFSGTLPVAIGWRRGSSEQAVPRTSVGAAVPCRAAQDRAVPVVGKEAGAAVDRDPTEHDVEAVFSAAESLLRLEKLLSQMQTPTVPSGGGCASCGHAHAPCAVPPSPSVSAARVSPAAPTCSTLHVH